MATVLNIIERLSKTHSQCQCIRCKHAFITRHADAKRSKIGDQCPACKAKGKDGLDNLTKEDLWELFTYNPDTGLLSHNWNTVHKLQGDDATYMHSQGYLSIAVGNSEYLAHRVIWKMMTGSWPNGQVDHKNHKRTDNRWENLREVSSRENQLNTGKKKNNSSGVNGVRILPSGRFCAFIMVNRKQISLGTYDTLEEAANARTEANKFYAFHENHGK